MAEKTIDEFKGWFRKSRDHLSDWREEALEDYAFGAGDQWSEDDKSLLEEQLRPCITFNRTGPVIDAIVGNEIQNRQEVRYIPRQVGDSAVNEMLTEAGRWFRDQSDAEDEETDAFIDLVTCGLGWTETRLDYEENPDGEPLIERIDPMEMFYDHMAKKRNLADRRYDFRVKDLARSEAEEMFPDAEEGTLHAAWAQTALDDHKDPQNAEDAQFYRDKMWDQDPLGAKDKVRVVEVQWWEKEDYFRVADPQSGQVQELSSADHSKLQERAKLIGIPIKSVKQKRKVFYRAFLGSEVLEQSALKANSFTHKVMTGKRDRNKGTFFGIVRQMKDPQRWANKWLSQTLHIMNSNAKGGLLAETGAFDNIAKAEANWANPAGIVMLKPGGMGKVQERQMAQFPAGFMQMTEFAITSIRDSTGVNMELLGMAGRDQPGILEQQRKQAGMTILATMFDSLRRYRKDQGKLMLYYITHYLSDGRLVRILGEEGAKYVPLIKDPTVTEYDVIVDDSPTSPNQKEQVFGTLMSLFPSLAKMGLPNEMWAELIKYSPLPESLTSKLSEMIAKGGQAQGPSPEQMQVQQEAQAMQQRMQMDQQEMQQKQQLEQQKAISQSDLEMKKAILSAATQVEVAKIQAKTDVDSTMFEAQLQHALGMHEANVGAETDRHATEMQAGVDAATAEPSEGSPSQISVFSPRNNPVTRQAETLAKALESLQLSNHAVAKSTIQSHEAMTQMLAQAMASIVGASHAQAGPKRVVRDIEGKVIGIEPVMQ